MDSDGGLSGRSTKLERRQNELRLRKSKGLTVATPGAAAGVSTGMLSQAENGAISSSLATLFALAAALSVPITVRAD
jgi:transcriptional regulator with XRE-family HTH domain